MSQVIGSGVDITESVAVDWVARNLYWVDATLETIEAADLEGNNRVILFTENVTNPRGLALDPRERYGECRCHSSHSVLSTVI